MALPSFKGLRVLTFESRRAAEVSALISTYGGEPLVVPILKEVPIEANPAAPVPVFSRIPMRYTSS
jgi:uroporphyrinogen-III synthase